MSKTAKALRKLALMRAREREGTFQARAQRREQEEALEKAIEQQNKKAMKVFQVLRVLRLVRQGQRRGQLGKPPFPR